MDLAQAITLIAATVAMGLVAGLFYTFAQAVMPGLRSTDDSTFIASFQAVDRAIDNPWQAAGFLGAAVFTAAAAALHLQAGDRSALTWIVAALLLYGAVLAITVRVHLPLNRAIQAAGEPSRIPDAVTVRDRFESTWVRWNIVRVALSTIALSFLSGALLLSGDG